MKLRQINLPQAWNVARSELIRILGREFSLPDQTGNAGKVLHTDGEDTYWDTAGGGSGAPADGDKGDITVSSSGTVWTVDNDAITYAKIQNVSDTDKILGRSTAGAGDVEEITCTSAGRALLDDADAAAQRTTLDVPQADLFKVLSADASASNVNTAQPWFPSAGAVTVSASTTYWMDGWLNLANGTTTHTTAVGFGGTATLTSVDYASILWSVAANTVTTTQSTVHQNAATSKVLNATSTAATTQILIKGVIRIDAGGTLIPQFTFSAAPGGTNTVKRNTYFRLTPIGTNTVETKGTWA